MNDFTIGDFVRRIKGQVPFQGKVVGKYSVPNTPDGLVVNYYCPDRKRCIGLVHVYPANQFKLSAKEEFEIERVEELDEIRVEILKEIRPIITVGGVVMLLFGVIVGATVATILI